MYLIKTIGKTMDNLISKEDLNIWADYLLDYSIDGISKDDVIMIKGEKICWPLISVIQDKIFAAGAIADVNLIPPDNDRGKIWGSSIARYGTTDQINKIPQWQIDRYSNMTKYIEILGTEDPELFTGQNDELAQAVIRADEPIKNIRMGKPWVLTLFPTEGFAKMEGLTLEDYTSVIVSASTVNPELLEDIEEEIYKLMDKSSTILIQTEHPDSGKLLELSMKISDHNIVKCTGKRNFPDGEVYTSPDANTTEGEIYVDLPVFQGGALIQGIYLKFKDGKIIDYSAKKGPEVLSKIIETDEGSHRLGEVALGMITVSKKFLNIHSLLKKLEEHFILQLVLAIQIVIIQMRKI